MPAGRPESGGASGGPSGPNAAGRTSFRPPWVKDGPKPIPMPTAPWTLNKRGKETTESQQQQQQQPEGPPARKTSTVKIVPMQPAENGSVKDPHTFERPKLREVPKPKETTKLQSKEVKVPITLTRRESKDVPIQVHIESKKTKEPTIPKVDLKPVNKESPREPVKQDTAREQEDIDKVMPAQRNAIVRQESLKKVCPAPPPMPPPPPPPPAMPFPKRDDMNRLQLEKIESLRSRPRKRPDWAAMMKEVESGPKLKHVECNDRSQPVLPQNKAKGQFIYESEQATLHNQLLRQIQTGALLKHVKTNDRSRPFIAGLRKFRRQMTIEEQIIKSQSMANMPEAEVEEEVDEMDDIDKVRDDLQSTKQMLALELRNKEAQIRENKRLLARLANLEAELEKERQCAESVQNNTGPPRPADEKILKSLKDEASEAKKTADVLEKKYHDTADQLDVAKTDLDEARRQNQMLEKKLQQAMQVGGVKRQSISDRRESVPGKEQPPPEEDSEEESETESESGEEDNEEKQKRRAEREVRLLGNKLRSFKNKEEAARRERKNLREQMKKNQKTMKVEKKRYRGLQKEVNKMAAMMKDDEEDEDDEEKEESEAEEETESEESESESESSDEEDSSESEDEEAPLEEQKESLQTRVKRHENCLNALKKGNYMLKANVDRLQDDLNKQKEMVVSLQEDLDSVLSELG